MIVINDITGERHIEMGERGRINQYEYDNTQPSEYLQQVLAVYSNTGIDRYKLLDDAYRAEGGFEDGSYLIPHPSERAEKYLRRKNMSYYINYVKPIVNSLVNPIFKTDPIRDNISSQYKAFAEDVDGNGTTLTRFMKKAAIRAKLHGVEFIVMDMDKVDISKPITKKEQAEKRLYPYLYLVSPAQIDRWYQDKLGKLISITYWIDNNELQADGTARKVRERWTWTNEFYIKEIEGKEEKEVNPIGQIPIIPVFGTRNDTNTLIPQSDMYSIARTNHALFNACSELRERNRAQAFSLLTIPIEPDDDFDASEAAPVQYGTADTLVYKQGSQAPAWITPPSASSDIIRDEIRMMVQEIYRMASLRLKGESLGYNISGIAFSYDNQQLYQTIGEFAQEIKSSEEKLAYIFGKYTGEDNSNIAITYNSEFGVIDNSVLLANAVTALQMNISPEANKEIKKLVIKGILENQDDSVLRKVLESFEAQSDGGTPLTPDEVSVVQPMSR